MTMRLAPTTLHACLLAALLLLGARADARAQTSQPNVVASHVHAASPHEQQKAVTLHLEQTPLGEALRALSQKSALRFLYSSAHVPVGKEITLHLEEGPPTEAMRRILEAAGLTYRKTESGQVVPMQRSWSEEKQEGTITGTVTSDATGETLPGVNVAVEGTAQGAATDTSGRYTITGVEAGTYTVRASFVGYGDEVEEGVEVSAGETTTVDFAMQRQATGLDEVVVVGYGEQERQDLTGAISSVSGSEVEDLPLTSVEQALEGQMAGVQVLSIVFKMISSLRAVATSASFLALPFSSKR